VAGKRGSGRGLRSRVRGGRGFPILLLEGQGLLAIKGGLWLVLGPFRENIVGCLKIAFVYSSDCPGFEIEFGAIFRHVPWLRVPSGLAGVGILWWSGACVGVGLGSCSGGSWGAAGRAAF